MFKKHFSLIVVSLFLLVSSVAFGEGMKEKKFGIGYEVSLNPKTWGISGVMNVTDNVSVQGIVGLCNDIGMLNVRYAGKGIYKFSKYEATDRCTAGGFHGYGMIGAWSYQWEEGNGGNLVEKTETTLGVGAGVGWYGLPHLNPKTLLNKMQCYVEIGVLKLNKFKDAPYNDTYKTRFSCGVHYPF